MKKTAFTLIELLVVIAIIAILAAILFPVFAQAKMAAKKTAALSNAKQIATANMMYMGDYDDHLVKEFFGFPASYSDPWPSVASAYYGWRHVVAPYLKNVDIFADPTNPFSGKIYWVSTWDSNDDGDVNDQYERLPTNYAVNNCVIGFANGQLWGQWTPPGLDSLDQIEDVAGTILMLPSRAQWNDLKPSFLGTDEGKPGWCITPQGSSNAVCPADPNGPIHAVNGKYVAWIWADGHAKAKAPLATLDPTNPNRDDWSSKLAINPRTGTYWTQADRIDVVNKAWGEYK